MVARTYDDHWCHWKDMLKRLGLYCDCVGGVLGGWVESICFMVVDVRDDHGQPFLEVSVLEFGGCSPMIYNYLVKRQVGDADGFLTDAERERLGMQLSEEEVEERAKRDRESHMQAVKVEQFEVKAEEDDGNNTRPSKAIKRE